MSQTNYKRMMQIIDEVFATRSDPGQLQVTEAQLKKLQSIHPATLSEFADADGPLIWALMIPTTAEVMEAFISGRITEKELLDKTQPGAAYDCIYLCSVTTLPELRGKGMTHKLCMQAIRSIMKDHPVTTLFVWPFTPAGKALAQRLATDCGLDLKEKIH